MGRLRAGSLPVPPISESLPPTRDASTAIAVSDTGLVAVLDTNHLVRWDGRVLGRTKVHTGELNPGGAFDPSGSSFAYGRWHAARAATSMGVAEGAVTAHRLPPDVYPDGADVRPLGWIDDDLMVLQVTPLDAEGQDTGGHQVVVTTREVSSTSTYRIVAHTDGGVPDNLSVAVDLMTLERPTVDRPEPDWPWSEERWVAVIGLGLGGGTGAAAGAPPDTPAPPAVTRSRRRAGAQPRSARYASWARTDSSAAPHSTGSTSA